MGNRTKFPGVFWVANIIEILERFAYYGIYIGFAVYMTHLGFSKSQLGVVQTLFLLISYTIPIIAGTPKDAAEATKTNRAPERMPGIARGMVISLITISIPIKSGMIF